MAAVSYGKKIIPIDVISVQAENGSDTTRIIKGPIITSEVTIDSELRPEHITNVVEGDTWRLDISGRIPDSGISDEALASTGCVGYPRLEIMPHGKAFPRLCIVSTGYLSLDDGREAYNFSGILYDKDGNYVGGTNYGYSTYFSAVTTWARFTFYCADDELYIITSPLFDFSNDPDRGYYVSERILEDLLNIFGIEPEEFTVPDKLYMDNVIYADGVGKEYGVKPIVKVRYGEDVFREISSSPLNNPYSGEAVEKEFVKYDVINGLYFTESHDKDVYSLTITLKVDGVSLSNDFRFALSTGNSSPYEPGGTTGGETGNESSGGGGSFLQPEKTPTIIPDGSSELDSSNAGIFSRYLVSPSQLKLFGDWLWTDDIIQAFLKEIMNIVYGKSSEAIISLMSYPFSMAGIGLGITQSNLWFGNMDSEVISSGRLTKEFATIDWGTISLDGYWNNFLDYAPHTTIQLYLPWLGFVPVDPHECLPGTLSIKTNIELGRGTATHNVLGNGGVCIGQYSTVCARQLPITALDTGGKLTSMVVSAIAAGVSAGAAGGAKSAGIASANSWQAAAARYSAPTWQAGNRAVEAMAARAEAPYRRVQAGANRVAATSAVASLRPPQIHQRSGSSTGNSAGLGCQYPYVIIGRPIQSVPQQYGTHFGYPSNIYANLGMLSGYTEIGSIHLDGFSCTIEERGEIEELLKGGVIF